MLSLGLTATQDAEAVKCNLAYGECGLSTSVTNKSGFVYIKSTAYHLTSGCLATHGLAVRYQTDNDPVSWSGCDSSHVLWPVGNWANGAESCNNLNYYSS